MWLYRYPRPREITYDQGKEFIGHKFRKSLIETEYGITSKPSTLGNPMSNTVLERIHQVLGNIVWTFNMKQTYIDKDYPWTVILAAVESAIQSITNRKKGYSTSQMIFGRDKIILINKQWNKKLIYQQNQA